MKFWISNVLTLCLIAIFCVPSQITAKRSRSGLVVAHQEYTHLVENNKTRPWKAPNYEEQGTPLGYTSETFAVPEKLRESFQFWVDIYSKYSTHQGLLHDSLYPHLVYEVIDFSDIDENTDLTDVQKLLKRTEFVKQRKKHIKQLILSLQTLKESQQEDWSSEQKRLWTLFQRVEEKRKYKKAATERRLRFQLGQKDRFLHGIFYSGRYLEKMEKIFREANLPLELTRLPFVESSFNILARSKVGASGIWQFMPRTGKEYMTVNALVDERNDPITSTRASAKMLKLNYNRLQDWPLAITAYNFGLYGIRRLVKRRGTSDLVEIIHSKKRSHRFGFASANFYSSFLAAVFVEQHADQYFTQAEQPPVWAEHLDYEIIQTQLPVSFSYLTSFFNDDKNIAFLYNPHLNKNIQKGYVNIPKGTKLYLKRGKTQAFINNIPQNTPSLLYKVKRGDTLVKIAKKFDVSSKNLQITNKIANPNRLKVGQNLIIPGHSPQTNQFVYQVTRGDTLLKIARKFDVSSRSLMMANDLANPNRLKVGQSLVIPDIFRKTSPILYKVARGDTLLKIAGKFDVSSQSLIRANKIANPNRIRMGQTLLIPK